MRGGRRRVVTIMASVLLLGLATPAIATDTDGDGLRDGFERRYGFNPDRPDTDGDGVIDAAEDNDRDGLGNLGEQRFGSHPRDRDTDRDGISDGQEDDDGDGRSNARDQDKRKVPDRLRPSLGWAAYDLPPLRETCMTENGHAYPVVCGFGPLGATKVVLLGDSHAMMWSSPIRRIAQGHDWRFLTMTKSACPMLLGLHTKRQHGIDGGTTCQRWRRNVIGRLSAYPPDLIIITQSDRYTLTAPSGQVVPRSDRRRLWNAALKRTLEALPRASEVLVLGDVPHNRSNPLRCLKKDRSDMSRCVTAKPSSKQRRIEFGLRDTARANGARYGTLFGKICSYDPCPVVQGDILMWRDRSHVTNRFAVTLQPALRATIEAALR